jgi:hypothetical protein
MKRILGLRKHPYIARVGIFLIAIALIVGTVSCNGGSGGVTYNLIMAVAPGGSGNAIDQSNGSPYLAGTPVDIEAIAAVNYQFVIWMAPAGTFVNATAAQTTFIMPAQDVTVTAIFVKLYDGGGGVPYNLTMAVAPGGSGNAIDQTDFSPYLAGTPISIKAMAAVNYQFVSWTAPAGTFVNATAAQTTFIMPAQDVTVTANFAGLYDLTVAVTPVGEGTASDLTGASPYLAGTVVSIQVVTNSTAGYQFFSWTAPAGTFDNATAATTTFTMPAQDVTVTAHFVVPQLDHFKGYLADDVTGLSIDEDVYLEDQFGAYNVTVRDVRGFFNPAEKQHEGDVTPIWNRDHHLAVYDLTCSEGLEWQQVQVFNQFGLQELTVSGPAALAVPTTKEGHETAVGLDHYVLYQVMNMAYWEIAVNLTDQFGSNPAITMLQPVYFAIPVQITHKGEVTEIVNPEEHAVIYWINGESYETQLQVDNQFGPQTLDVSDPRYIFVPSQKIVPPVPALDHFKCYEVVNATSVPFILMNLEDEFVYLPWWAVETAEWFCNPVMKNSEPIVNPDNHLTVYNIGLNMLWDVEIVNQFGPQNLTVSGPVALAVPTWKLDPGVHGPPTYLDHFLLYEVVQGSPVDVSVDLYDEFPDEATGVSVTMPRYFANPVLYKDRDGDVSGVWNRAAHLVFYQISDNPEYYSGVSISNQFETQSLELASTGQLLAVPSEKLYYEEIIP